MLAGHEDLKAFMPAVMTGIMATHLLPASAPFMQIWPSLNLKRAMTVHLRYQHFSLGKAMICCNPERLYSASKARQSAMGPRPAS